MKLEFDEVAVAGLTKAYGSTLAVSGVDLHLRRGTVTAVLGANGSGKSTLLWLLALLARPTRGEVRFGGYGREHAAEIRGQIGFVAHQLQLYPGLSGLENLRLSSELYRVSSAEARIGALDESLSLSEYWARPLRTYSRGQAQRIAIARALLHTPTLLLMDEPSTGLDERSTDVLARLIAQEKQAGAIVVIVSHELAFAERVADRVVRMKRGRIQGGEP